MAVLLTIILSALLFLTLEIIWCIPARDPYRAAPVQDRPDPLALTFVRHRLDVLAAELERLDDDPEIFALAFRTNVARSAYRSLLDEAIHLADASRFAGLPALADVTRVEVDRPESRSSVHEVLSV